MRIVLDAQLLVLLVVGAASTAYIGRHKRLRAYTTGDYLLLCKRLAPPAEIVVTPNVLTEVSNIAGQIAEPARGKVMAALAGMIAATSERSVRSADVTGRPEFRRLGLTDSVLLTTSSDSELLLTADLDLYLAASYSGIRVENFNFTRGA